MMTLDLNCDLGEGCPHDAELMKWITSANVACGAHAGDAGIMLQTLRLAQAHGVQVGAHPGFFDRDGFGRAELELNPELVFAECLYQLGALQALARAVGVVVRYVKPHGALYNQACRDRLYAEPIVAAAQQIGLAVMGLPNSALAAVMRTHGSGKFIAEGFADRRYMPDGSLVPRSQPNAFVHHPAEAVQQAEWLLRECGVQTLCVHGDNPHAVDFVRELRQQLQRQGFVIRSFDVGTER
jgi:UPF0271 protein